VLADTGFIVHRPTMVFPLSSNRTSAGAADAAAAPAPMGSSAQGLTHSSTSRLDVSTLGGMQWVDAGFQ